MLVDVLAAVALAAWLGVLLLPSAPWRTREQLTPEKSGSEKLGSEPISPEMGSDPNFMGEADLSGVAVLIPARNEATAIAATLEGLTRQGRNLRVLLIDDQSSDGTGEVAIEANAGFALPLDLTIIDGEALPPGWGGKLWALNQGLQQVDRDYCLLLDAEIVLSSGVLSTLLQQTIAESRAMTSVMAKLRCETFWEKLLVPPFIFFFKLLYPFAAVNDPARKTAAAAGGCILIRTDVLNAIGGFAAIRDALIDDCTLAARVKAAGHSVWLGLSEYVTSSRSYPNLVDFRRMVARTAFTQLRYSVVLLVLVVDIMIIIFVAPILALGFSTEGWGLAAGIGALAAMAVAFWPTVRFYSLTPLWVLTLPVAAVLFLAMTIESAVQYWRGVTARWKGRTYPSRL